MTIAALKNQVDELAPVRKEALPKAKPEAKLNGGTGGVAEHVESGELWGRVLDLEALSERSPEPPREIMLGLPCGYATLSAGHGGAGKSTIELTRAVCIAAGVPFFELPVERRRVLYLSCEDREPVLHWRLSRICAYLGINLAGLRGWLEVLDLVGRDTVLWERDPRTGYTITPAFGRLSEMVREHETEVLFVDGTADSFGGNENARGEVKRYVNALVGLIPPERGAVVLIAHVAKMTAAGAATSEGYSGSTAWHNAARARWYLYPERAQGDDGERTGDLILELQKSNHGRADQQIRFKWDEAAHLFVGKPIGNSNFDRKHQDREEQAAIRRAIKACMDGGMNVPAAMTGPRTAFHVLIQRPEFPDTLRGSERAKSRRFWRQIETLRQMRHIAESSYRRTDNRHTLAIFILTPEGSAECA